MSRSRTRTRDEVLVDEVRESPVDVYLLRRRRIVSIVVVLVVLVLVAIAAAG